MTPSDDAGRIRTHFSRSAIRFDSLYGEEEMHPIRRWVNRTFRRDIYERYVRTIEHVRIHRLRSALDVGCGSGRYAIGLAEAGARRIVGVDFSPHMIELAAANTSGLGTADVELVCADFAEFQTDERFDVVIAMGFFDYVADPVSILARMRELARHSVVASFPSVSVYRTPLRKVRYVLRGLPVYFYDADEIAGFSDAAGFARHEVEKIRGAGMDYVAAFYR